MIFITVGTQLAFPRLFRLFEEAVPELIESAFAQTADPAYGGPIPNVPTMSRTEFEDTCARARLIVGHAGMGTIFAARRHLKPLIAVPRQFAFGEHRNDHQLGTAEQLSGVNGVAVCHTREELARAVRSPPGPMRPSEGIAREQLVSALKSFIDKSLG